MSSPKRILVTNDDSYVSPGLYLLYEAVKDLGEVLVFSTEYPRSALGHTITFSKPLRIYEARVKGFTVYVTDGTPVDVVHMAVEVLGFKPDMVLSGINVGDNLTLQHIFYSGTVAAAIEAALIGIPAIAFSAQVSTFEELEQPRFREMAIPVVSRLVRAVLERGWIDGVDVLNVNFPPPEKYRGCIRVARAGRLRWRAGYEKRYDPRQKPYYWLYGKPVELEEGTDAYAVEVEGCISVTPLTIDLNVKEQTTIRKVAALLENSVK